MHTGRRQQGVRRIVPTSLHFSFGPSGDWRPWIRALGHLSNSLSERDPAGQLARARIGQVDGFSSLEPSTMVLSLRWWIGDSSCDLCLLHLFLHRLVEYELMIVDAWIVILSS